MTLNLKVGTKFEVATSTGKKTMEILRVRKTGVDARDVKLSGMDVILTGYKWYGIGHIAAAVNAGELVICE